MGELNGTPWSHAIRKSVIWRSEGFEFVLVFCGSASSVSSVQKPSPAAPAAPAAPLKNERRPRKFLFEDMNAPFAQDCVAALEDETIQHLQFAHKEVEVASSLAPLL